MTDTEKNLQAIAKFGEAAERDAARYRQRIEEIRQFSHKMDDMAQGITEQQVYALSTELRVLLGIDDNDENTDHTDYTPVDNSTWAPRS